ncbi:MAG: SDR family oxidoreductase [Proteobacteria bacterium]|nr:SDR family oxidoreductase [Pseudomonadota bacterium]MCZ6783613.1 SDR family oxidoreductase [Pseudomonadota bacterium]
MAKLCGGRVAVVTGAGRGIGRGHALEFARQGAKVVVNDLGGFTDGRGSSGAPAEEVVAEIRDAGGEAIANFDDVADWKGAENLIQSAVDHFGGIDVLVNNAGILRDRMLFNMTEEEWDSVIRVHLKGTFCTSRMAAAHWRELSKGGRSVAGRIINTSSVSGLFGNPGQSNYGAAKAGIAAFTIIAARELERYGVTVNAVSPGARTRMTENLRPGGADVPEEGFDARSPENVAPVVVWLGSLESSDVTGQVFEVMGGRICLNQGWTRGPRVKQDERWDPNDLGPVIHDLLSRREQAEPMSSRGRD